MKQTAIMNRRWLGSLAAFCLLACSCAKDSTTEEDLTLKFKGKIANLQATTNTGGGLSTTWSNLDDIGIFMVDHNTTNITEQHENRQYSYDGTAFSPVAGHEIYYPVSDTKVDFLAYYPYTNDASLESAFPIDVSKQHNLAAIDVLWAKSNNSNAGFSKTTGLDVPLVFDHKLAKLVIGTVAGEGLDSEDLSWKKMAVQIAGMYTKNNLDLTTGQLGQSSAPAVIVPFVQQEGRKYEAIILPADFTSAGAVSFNFTIGTDTYVWKSGANESFEAGKQYNYSITINKTEVTLDKITIQDWTTVSRTGIAN